MGWRVLKSSNLLVRSTESLNTIEPDEVQWVTLEFSFHMKCMKLGVFESRSDTLPSSSLVLSPNSVNIEIPSNDSSRIVWIRTKEGRTILLSTEGLGVHISEVSHWRNLFKSAINPTGTYAVTLVKGEKHAILCVQDKSVVQLSVNETSPSSTLSRKDNNIISTDVVEVKLTVDDCISFKLNKKSVSLRTNRLVELYQRLLEFSTEGSKETGNIQISDPDCDTSAINHPELMSPAAAAVEEEEDAYVPYENPYGYVLPDYKKKSSPPTRQPPKLSPLIASKISTLASPSSLIKVVTKKCNTFHGTSTVASVPLRASSSKMQFKNLKISKPFGLDMDRVKPAVSPKPNLSTKPSSLNLTNSNHHTEYKVISPKKEVVYATVSKPQTSSSSDEISSSDPLLSACSDNKLKLPSKVKHEYENVNNARRYADHVYQNNIQKGIAQMNCDLYENMNSILKNDPTPTPKTYKRLPSPPRDEITPPYPTKRASIDGRSTLHKGSGSNAVNCQNKLKMPGDFANTILQFDRNQLRPSKNNRKNVL